MSEPERILSKVDYTDNCWVWTWSLDRHGYGQVRLNGTTRRAHRVIYELLVDDVPKNLDMDHLCRNRACVNPEHLEPVTRSTNLLRGELWQSKKTHCPKGHLYDMKDSRGGRRCLTCLRHYSRLRQKRYIERKKNAQSSMLS